MHDLCIFPLDMEINMHYYSFIYEKRFKGGFDMKTVFIDGSAGTTGLRIRQRLAARPDLLLLELPEYRRKDPDARCRALNGCDVAFLCLPDAAAVEAAAMVENPDVVVLDASTAHRTASGWTYGFAELSPAHQAQIARSRRIAVPGCHASGFVALIAPLLAAGLLREDALLCCTSVTGYSGGGKKMIAAYEAPDRAPLLDAPRQYALSQQHKHLKEMQAVTGLINTPCFSPIVSGFYSGMAVSVPVFRQQLSPGVTAAMVKEYYAEHYRGPVVRYLEAADEDGFFSANKLAGKDSMEISVFGNEDRLLLAARYDNLGKGASGAAVACMNLAIGAEMTAGLEL